MPPAATYCLSTELRVSYRKMIIAEERMKRA
jgi:hypothetical protein